MTGRGDRYQRSPIRCLGVSKGECWVYSEKIRNIRVTSYYCYRVYVFRFKTNVHVSVYYIYFVIHFYIFLGSIWCKMKWTIWCSLLINYLHG